MLHDIISRQDQYLVAQARADIAVTTARACAVVVNFGAYIQLKFQHLEDPTASTPVILDPVTMTAFVD